MKTITKTYKALPDETRIRVLNVLHDEGLCVCNIMDVAGNVWWKSTSVNTNNITPVFADPIDGLHGWYDAIVKAEPAQSGDKFGAAQLDNNKHFEFFKETMRYASTGDKHREMYPEVKVGKLPLRGDESIENFFE